VVDDGITVVAYCHEFEVRINVVPPRMSDGIVIRPRYDFVVESSIAFEAKLNNCVLVRLTPTAKVCTISTEILANDFLIVNIFLYAIKPFAGAEEYCDHQSKEN